MFFRIFLRKKFSVLKKCDKELVDMRIVWGQTSTATADDDDNNDNHNYNSKYNIKYNNYSGINYSYGNDGQNDDYNNYNTVNNNNNNYVESKYNNTSINYCNDID